MSFLAVIGRTLDLLVMFRLQGTVILAIWWQVVLLILYTTGVVCVHNYWWQMHFKLTLVSVMGGVTGLLLVFRTNTAYDRYWEGRKLWSTMTKEIRVLTRCIWAIVDEKEKTTREIIEKTSAINLLIAFAYATRNYLRGVYSYEEEDLRELINHLPKFSTPSSSQPLQGQAEETGGRLRKTMKSMKIRASKTANPEKAKESRSSCSSIMAFDTTVPTNIPIELILYIGTYIKSLKERELTDGNTLCIMYFALNSLTDCLGGFERILRTPIPLAYSVHLHHVTWMYLLALPYQLVGELNWFAIPAVGLASFALLGILGIGWEIENPFGYDDNDLPLDDFCKVIHREILTIIGHPMPTPESWLLNPENHPLFPESSLTASDLMEMTEPEVRLILSKASKCRLSIRNSHHPKGKTNVVEME